MEPSPSKGLFFRCVQDWLARGYPTPEVTGRESPSPASIEQKISMFDRKAYSCRKPMMQIGVLRAVYLLLVHMNANLPNQAVGGPGQKSSKHAASAARGLLQLVPQPMLQVSATSSATTVG